MLHAPISIGAMSDVDHTNEAIVRAARRALLADGTVDVGKVAAEVGVDRTTVYRRFGRRDQLVAEALWSVTAAHSWPASLAAHPNGTPHRAAEVLTTYVRLLIDEPWFRRFLERDPHAALRILTTSASPIQSRFTALVKDLLISDAEPRIDVDIDTLAHLIVRVAESYIYADLITGSTPDHTAAHTVFVELLG